MYHTWKVTYKQTNVGWRLKVGYTHKPQCLNAQDQPAPGSLDLKISTTLHNYVIIIVGCWRLCFLPLPTNAPPACGSDTPLAHSRRPTVAEVARVLNGNLSFPAGMHINATGDICK